MCPCHFHWWLRRVGLKQLFYIYSSATQSPVPSASHYLGLESRIGHETIRDTFMGRISEKCVLYPNIYKDRVCFGFIEHFILLYHQGLNYWSSTSRVKVTDAMWYVVSVSSNSKAWKMSITLKIVRFYLISLIELNKNPIGTIFIIMNN